MSPGDDIGNTARQLFDREEVDGVLSESFYSPATPQSAPQPNQEAEDKPMAEDKKQKPTHYKVICISMYTDALAQLDEMVKELKTRGYTKANRSALIRHALRTVDLDSVPRGL